MADRTTSVAALRATMREFVAERDWEQFHSPKNLVMGLAIETAELMEHFQWITLEESRQIVRDREKLAAVAEELADVAGYVFALTNALGLDLSDAVFAKMIKNAKKYPAATYRGRYRLESTSTPSG